MKHLDSMTIIQLAVIEEKEEESFVKQVLVLILIHLVAVEHLLQLKPIW